MNQRDPKHRQRQRTRRPQQLGDARRASRACRTELDQGVWQRTADLQKAHRRPEREVAEPRRAERARRQSEWTYASIAQNLPGGRVHIRDPDLRYLFSAGDQLRPVGLSHQMLVGKTIYPQEMCQLAREAMETDACAFLQKPFDVGDVLELVQDVSAMKTSGSTGAVDG